jgi:hypothetical protein
LTGEGDQRHLKNDLLLSPIFLQPFRQRLAFIPLDAFIARCEPYFGWDGCIIDQPYQPRLPDGMIRCYMSGSKVAGFGHQLIKALIQPSPEGSNSPEAQPGPRIMHGPDAPSFQALRRR